jgi:hypothetical protein
MPEPQIMFLASPSDRRRGRPPRSGVAATNRIEFTVTDTERKALQRVADEEGKPLATVIREAVNERVADYGEKKIFR